MAAAFSWYLARRYLLSRRINLLGIIGVAVAVWALIVVIAVFSGFIAEIRSGIHRASPDLLVTELGDDADFATLRPILAEDPGVEWLAPRLEHYAIFYAYGLHARYVQTPRAVEAGQLSRNFVRLVGIDPGAEARTSHFRDWLDAVTDGSHRVEDLDAPFALSLERVELARRMAGLEVPGGWLAHEDGILLSHRRLTRGEPIELGSRLDLVSGRFVANGAGGTVLAKGRWPTVVTGAFASGHRTFDESTAIVDIEFLRRMLGHGADESDIELVNQVAVKARPGTDLDALAARLDRILADQGIAGRALTWEEQNRTFLAAVDRERNMMKVVLFAVMLVAGFLIYATLHMMVVQKVRDVGVLTAMGATPAGIQAMFVGCGVVVAVLGCTLGGVAGMASAIYLNPINDFCRERFGVELFPTALYALDRIPFRLEAGWILQVIGAAAALSLLVAYLPARRAARLQPVQALAHY